MGYIQAIPPTTLGEVELKSLRKGLQVEIAHQFVPLAINIDAQEVVHMLQTSNPKYDILISECRQAGQGDNPARA